MPYEIRHDGKGDKPYCVYNKLTGKLAGCSATEEAAEEHMRALYANEKKENMDTIAILKDWALALIEKLGNIGGNKPRSELADSDFVFPKERKFPIVTAEDVPDAVHSWGRYKGPHTFAEFKARLISLCRRKGRAFVEALPKDWNVKEHKSAINVVKQEDGTWKWVAISSTGFLDRDEEIVSSEALSKAVEDAERRGLPLGNLTYWHEPNIVVGKCEHRFVEGVCLVETGTWLDDELSTALRKSVMDNPDLWAVSIEFLGNLTTASEDVQIKGTKVRRLWNDISFEGRDRSILPAWRASNTFSMVASKGGVEEMKQERLAFLTEVVGEALANQIAEGVDAVNRLAEADDSVVKEETVAGNGVEQQAAESTEAQAVESKAESSGPLNALRAFAASLDEAKQKELAVIIIELSKVLETDSEPKPGDDTPPDTTSYDSTANDETAKQAEKPSEEEPAAGGSPESAKGASSDLPAQEDQLGALRSELDGLKAQLTSLGEALVAVKEWAVRAKQESLPRGVVTRASEADDNMIDSEKEIDQLKAQSTDRRDPLASMTETIISKMLGGV